MSLDKTVGLVEKLVVSASCPYCGCRYEYPELASCGHRMCKLCWKTKKKCPTCDEDVDHSYLQEDVLMIKLAKSVQNNFVKFKNLSKSKEISDKLRISLDYPSQKNDYVLIENSSKIVLPKQKNMASPYSVCGSKNIDNNKIVIKKVQQDDFDKIECIEESQDIVKGKENFVGVCTEDFIIGNTEEMALRRSSRNKTNQEPVKETNKLSNKIVTEAAVEIYNDTKQNNSLSYSKKNSSNILSKQGNWKSVKKMKKELSKLNKRDVKKLNVSIEMCKKSQSVISNTVTSKHNVCVEPVTNTELQFTIEDNTQCSKDHFNTCALVSSLPEVVLDERLTKEVALSKQQPNFSVFQNNENSVIQEPLVNAAHVMDKDSSKAETNNPPTKSYSIPASSQPISLGADLVDATQNNPITPVSLEQSTTLTSNHLQLDSILENGKTVELSKSDTKQRSVSSATKKIIGRPTAKVRPSRQQKIPNKMLTSHRYKPYNRYRRRLEKKISLVNIITPQGNFVITGENVCIMKPYVSSSCLEKSTQTEDLEIVCRRQLEIPVEPVASASMSQNEPEHFNKPTSSLCKNKSPSEENKIKKFTQESEKTNKKNTASEDTVTGPFKITESVEKELVDEMERAVDYDMFTTPSEERADCISNDLFHTEFVAISSQKIETTQGSKRQMQKAEEPLKKKAKPNNANILTQNSITKKMLLMTQHDKHDKNQINVGTEINKETNETLSHEYDEITSKAFAQIDADIYEHTNKNTTHQVSKKTQDEANDSVNEIVDAYNLNTPKSTQNRVIDADSDTSIVEETPQKDKTLKPSSFNTQTSIVEVNKNIDSTTANPHIESHNKETNTNVIEEVNSPLTLAFSRGITDESTPVRSAPRRSLNFSKINVQKDSDADSFSNNSIGEVSKTTLEKEFMEKAFERTQKVAMPKKQMSLKKELTSRKHQIIQIACSCLSQDEKKEVVRLAHRHKWEFVESYTPKLTHLIVGVENKKAQRTVKYISALAGGKWILSFDWIVECNKRDCIVDEAPFEALDMTGYNGPALSRTASIKLFDGILFYCLPPFNMLERETLEDILEAAGGKIAKKIYEVSLKNTTSVAIVIAEPQNTLDQEYTCLAIQEKVVPVNYEWVFNSLGTYSLQPLLLLCSSSLISVDKLNWPRSLFDNDSAEELDTE